MIWWILGIGAAIFLFLAFMAGISDSKHEQPITPEELLLKSRKRMLSPKEWERLAYLTKWLNTELQNNINSEQTEYHTGFIETDSGHQTVNVLYELKDNFESAGWKTELKKVDYKFQFWFKMPQKNQEEIDKIRVEAEQEVEEILNSTTMKEEKVKQ